MSTDSVVDANTRAVVYEEDDNTNNGKGDVPPGYIVNSWGQIVEDPDYDAGGENDQAASV